MRIGDRKGGKDVLLGDGELPVAEFMNALRSLNYEGYLAADWNEEITDPDIVLTHFVSYISGKLPGRHKPREIFYNRDKSGTFPWKMVCIAEAAIFGLVIILVLLLKKCRY